MSVFREDIIENACSERELCLMDPYYFMSKYVMVSSKQSIQDTGDNFERALVKLNISRDEYNKMISKFVKDVW